MKKVITGMIMGSYLLTASAGLAAPVTMSGEASIKYAHEKQGDASESGMVYTLKVMAETELSNHLSAYSRLGIQRAGVAQLGDFNTDAYPDKNSVVSLDQYGLILKKNDFVYKLGRQDATVGTTALLYSRPDSNIGKKNFVDGLSASGTVGVADITALFARENNVADDNNRVYAIRAGYSPRESLNVGLTLGRFHNSSADSTNHWAVDSTYKAGRNSWTAEYTRSSANDSNQAYAASWNYDLDDRTAFTVTGFRVEANGDMGGQSDFANNNKGIHYGLSRTLKDNIAIELVYKNEKNISDGLKNKVFETTVSYTF